MTAIDSTECVSFEMEHAIALAAVLITLAAM
jgi:hypothetical protein